MEGADVTSSHGPLLGRGDRGFRKVALELEGMQRSRPWPLASVTFFSCPIFPFYSSHVP